MIGKGYENAIAADQHLLREFQTLHLCPLAHEPDEPAFGACPRRHEIVDLQQDSDWSELSAMTRLDKLRW